MKKLLLIFFLLIAPLTACSTLNEINEKAKGDGVPLAFSLISLKVEQAVKGAVSKKSINNNFFI